MEYLVTELVPLQQKKVKVYLNEEFAFVLYKGELSHWQLQQGEWITEERKKQIEQEVVVKRAKKRALYLLKSRDYTEEKLAEKLRQNCYTREQIDQVISYVKAYHYVDDLRYARDYIAYHCGSKPPKRLCYDLQRKGIDQAYIAQAMGEHELLQDPRHEEKMIEEFLQKKKIIREELTWEEKQKVSAMLMRKGFSYERVSRLLL